MAPLTNDPRDTDGYESPERNRQNDSDGDRFRLPQIVPVCLQVDYDGRPPEQCEQGPEDISGPASMKPVDWRQIRRVSGGFMIFDLKGHIFVPDDDIIKFLLWGGKIV